MQSTSAGKEAGHTKFPPAPDVPFDELAARLASIRKEMEADGLDVIVLTDVVNIQYFTDFKSFSWYYNSRPFFGIITADDLFVLAATYERAHVNWKPRVFSGLYYDGYIDQGVKLVADSIRDLFKGKSPRIGIDYGEEMAGHSSLALVDALRGLAKAGDLKTAAPTLWRSRLIKTPFEAALKRAAFTICDDAFNQAIAKARIGITEYELWGMITAQTFLNGAEGGVPFPLIFSKSDFTFGRPPGNRRLEEGHYIWADFRATYGGYPADRNRIARAGEPKAWERETYTAIRDLTLELCHMIRPGITCADFFHEAMKLWVPASVGNKWTAVARFGHSGGMGIVEPPSLGPDDHVEIRPGMILHVEPKLERDGAVFQFEECVYVREDGIEFLAPLCPETIPIINE
ncbi:Xaa-Pro peptidase family protein [Mesorhizobium sp.]|uniref:M24 family metallopeptidase n=2 Tax=unclassified Mesorhizobium TaxID=325217 RepID=UPI000FD3381D|nr:Xaa-Pro peptidase family protein [Mesorhizobium sp.]RUV96489.1 aminopeptidase P family protein [Mesorhizobium sp. M5C.F.Ca.IN.020.14.1.1]RWG50786.1 MAG: aminopeptidase P family protein [Mesorhizobium sp.]RWH55773.1 MAG: aminopeptidase P family protein [Mesorhizobium sp.]RWI67891.1 MAG: aminopeptidase P family protein [Mesorhizobium sp.]RWI77880.1 MAG: aminopeptidase P family protein [Mesorhizobium sp.]